MTILVTAGGKFRPRFTYPEDFTCRYCGAPAGDPCETPSGYETSRPHKPRRDARDANPVRLVPIAE